jgi:hypothetical protein
MNCSIIVRLSHILDPHSLNPLSRRKPLYPATPFLFHCPFNFPQLFLNLSEKTLSNVLKVEILFYVDVSVLLNTIALPFSNDV